MLQIRIQLDQWISGSDPCRQKWDTRPRKENFFCFEELSGGLEAFLGAWACFLETKKKNMSSFDQKKVFTVNFSTFVS